MISILDNINQNDLNAIVLGQGSISENTLINLCNHFKTLDRLTLDYVIIEETDNLTELLITICNNTNISVLGLNIEDNFDYEYIKSHITRDVEVRIPQDN